MIKRKIRKRQLEKAKLIVCNKLESVINKEFENINLDFSSFIPVNSVSFNSTVMNIENLTPVVGKRG